VQPLVEIESRGSATLADGKVYPFIVSRFASYSRGFDAGGYSGVSYDVPGGTLETVEPTRSGSGSIEYDNTIDFPAQTKTYNFTATAVSSSTNQPPNVTYVTGPPDIASCADLDSGPSCHFFSWSGSGAQSTPHTINLRATDPNGSRIRYEIDWDMDGTTDQQLPNTGYVDSGISQSVNRSWGVPGTKSFQVRTVDEEGLTSVFTEHSIDISSTATSSSVTTSFEASVNGGAWSASDQSITRGDTVRLRWGSTNADTCTGSSDRAGFTFNTGGTTQQPAPGVNAMVPDPGPAPAPPQSVQYALNCVSATDSETDTLTITVYSDAPPVVNASTSVDGGSFAPVDRTIFAGQEVQIQWTSSGAATCSGINIPLLSGLNGTEDIFEPGPGMSNTYGVRCTNSAGASSEREFLITTNPAPTITADLTVEQGGVTSQGPITVGITEDVTLSWTSTNADTCSGTNFSTGPGNATSGTNVAITEPAPGATQTYTLTCSGSAPDRTDTVVISTNSQPNLDRPNVSALNPSSGYDVVTNEYDFAEIFFNVENVGGGPTGAFTNRFRFDKGNTGSFGTDNVYSVSNLPAASASANETIVLSDVSIGDHRIEVTADNTDSVLESDETDNVYDEVVTLLPPDPGFLSSPNLGIWSDREVVRRGDTTRVSWDVGAAYPMGCRVLGQSNDIEFDPSDGPASITGFVDTDPINSSLLYVLSCTEPITSTTFRETVHIDVVGSLREI
jgi:hypothetical protein